MHPLTELLKRHQAEIASIFPFNLNEVPTVISDCSSNNKDLTTIDLTNVEAYSTLAQAFLAENGAIAGVGGYLEERIIYQGRGMFETEEEPRNIHLGIDVSVKAGTALHAPLPSTVHSFANNAQFGDYGPTIILAHTIENSQFFTLYGHLSVDSLKDLVVGQKIEKGAAFATLGDTHENGNWPPHLHFQLITDMLSYQGDFPGVCAKSKLPCYQNICPNPNWILKIDKLPF